MTLEALPRREFANEMGLAGPNGAASPRAVARLLREALCRWGLTPRRALLKHARDQLYAGGVNDGDVRGVLNRLIALGECAEVLVGHEPYVAPAESRWVAVREQVTLLGVTPPPAGARIVESDNHDDVVVRLQVGSEEEAALLESAGPRQILLSEWLSPLGYLQHAARRSRGPVRSDQLGLVGFWDLLLTALVEEGLPLGEDAEVRAVVRPPGGFFGRHSVAAVEGRWGTDLPEGVWCAYRQGHGEGRWLPVIVAVDGKERRGLDLYDHDEWRWALLARGRAVGEDEVRRREDGQEITTWPLPTQLGAALDIIGTPAGLWRWDVADGAPDLWELLK